VILRPVELAHARKILVRATNWVGDAVMSLPALEALRRRFPAAEIVLLTKPWVSELYWHHAAVNRLIVYNPRAEHQGVRGFRALIAELRSERFDAAILFQNAFHAAWMARLAGIPVRIGYATDGRTPLLTHPVEIPPAGHYGHQSYYYLQLLYRAGLAGRPAPIGRIRLAAQPSEKTWAAKRLRAMGLAGPRFFVAIIAGAAFGPAKQWIPGRVADLADRLIGALHADVLLFGSREERPLAEAIAQAMRHTPLILAGETSLRQLIALLSQCRLLISNDSGPMHLGAALGVPVVAIFGSTDARTTGPLSPRARVVQHPVDCNPCGRRICPIDFRCMQGVSVEDVHRTALALIKEVGATHDNALEA
jgi:heptosyltransferase-2